MFSKSYENTLWNVKYTNKILKHKACIMRACVYLLSIWDGQLRIIGICYMFVYQKFINKSVVQQFFVIFGHCNEKWAVGLVKTNEKCFQNRRYITFKIVPRYEL